ncbi:MAG TPA: hypothetical protein VMV60_13745 [Thermoanaerobaculia bacterium]|nr:hypothetical protein [Thermoanaerobaculia bacterium]
MRTKTSRLLAGGGAVALSLLALPGCATGRNDMTRPIVGPPVNVPDHFMVVVSGVARVEEPKAGEGCKNPLADPRGKTIRTTLSLRRSADGIGDYAVETMGDESLGVDGKVYGLTSRQLLRIDCATGKALGIVDQ